MNRRGVDEKESLACKQYLVVATHNNMTIFIKHDNTFSR